MQPKMMIHVEGQSTKEGLGCFRNPHSFLRRGASSPQVRQTLQKSVENLCFGLGILHGPWAMGHMGNPHGDPHGESPMGILPGALGPCVALCGGSPIEPLQPIF